MEQRAAYLKVVHPIARDHASAATPLPPPLSSPTFRSWLPLLGHAYVTMSTYRSLPDSL
jgi:hypothetical protein